MTSTITAAVTFALLCLCCVTSLASSRDLSAAAATRDAKRDISSGCMKIYFAGTEAASEQGLERRDVALVRRLPRDYTLPMGCTDPHAVAAIKYASVYNRAIIEHLRRAQSH